MSRIRLITGPEGLDPDQLAVYERIASGARSGVRGPHTVLINKPDLAAPVERLGVYVRYECSVPERLRELAILIVAVRWKADYEWFAHAPLARRQGFTEDVLEILGKGETPRFAEDADRAVHDFVSRLGRHGRVDDETYALAERYLGTEGVLDLTALVGYYTLLAFTLNAFEVDVPDSSNIPWR